MKRFFLLLFSLFAVFVTMKSQVVNDAIKLERCIKNNHVDTALSILASYIETKDDSISLEEIAAAYTEDKSLTVFLAKLLSQKKELDEAIKQLDRGVIKISKNDLKSDAAKNALDDYQKTSNAFNALTTSLNVISQDASIISPGNSGNLDSILLQKYRIDSVSNLDRRKAVCDSLLLIIDALSHQKGSLLREIGLSLKLIKDDIKNKLPDGVKNNADAILQGAPILAGSFSTSLAQSESGSTISSSANNLKLAIPSQTAVIDAVGIFVANRFKEEVALSFVDGIRDKIKTDGYLARMFPNTVANLDAQRAYDFPVFGNEWNMALAKDITAMPVTLASFKGSFISTERAALFSSLIEMYQKIQNGGDVSDAFSGMAQSISTQHSEYSNALNFFQIIEDIAGEGNEKKGKLVNGIQSLNANQKKYLWSLIAVRYSGLFKKMNINLSTNMTYDNLTKLVLPVAIKYDELYKATLLLRDGSQDYKTVVRFYWQSFSQLFVELIKLSSIGQNITNGNKSINDITLLIQQLNDIYDAINQGQYGRVILTSVSILEQNIQFKHNSALSTSLNKSGKELLETMNSMSSGDASAKEAMRTKINSLSSMAPVSAYWNYYAMMKEVTAIIKTAAFSQADEQKMIDSLNSKIGTALIRYDKYIHQSGSEELQNLKLCANFIADVFLADGDNQKLTKVIEKYAAHSHSYKIKRNSTFSLDVNTYPGVYVASIEAKYPDFTNWAPVVGFTTPIGLSLSWGRRYSIVKNLSEIGNKTFLAKDGQLKNFSGRSWSVTITALDIGAVVSYRLQNGAEGALPEEVKFNQFFAPGLYCSWGLHNSPFTFTLGGQINPELRDFNRNGQPENTFKFVGGAILVDIPLYNICHKTGVTKNKN